MAGGDFFDGQHHRQIIQAGAAPAFRDHHAHHPQFGQFGQGFAREGSGTLPFGGVGRQPLPREVP